MPFGFSEKLIAATICQKDGGQLILNKIIQADDKKIINGDLRCVSCGKVYEIKQGILNLLDGQLGLDEILQTEIKARDIAAENYDKKLAGRYDKEIPSTIKELGELDNKKIIEYGCGTWRLTTEILSCSEILAVDFSRNSLLILADKIKKENIGLVLADVSQLKTKENHFDLALAAQVLEHIPRLQQRKIFLENVFSSLRSGGRFVCSAYHQDLRRRLKKQTSEGRHQSGIFFHFFTSKEIFKEFTGIFKIKRNKIIDITLPLEVKFGLSKFFKGKVSRFLENIPVLNTLGHLVLVTAIKNGKR